jgi:excisionase family DNA binding protein
MAYVELETMTTKEAAELLGVDISHMRRLIRSKKIKAIKVRTRNNQFGYEYQVDRQSIKSYNKRTKHNDY